MENDGAKRVLFTSNGDDVTVNIALRLAERGCRLVLMGSEGCLRKVKEKITKSAKGAAAEVVGLNMEDEREGGIPIQQF